MTALDYMVIRTRKVNRWLLYNNVRCFTDETENFIQRWGTHFIKSAKFGGELEIRKTMDAKQAGTKTKFSEEMEFEYKSLFASVGAKYKNEGGTSVKQETKTTSTAVEAKGGSQDIASILSDVYAPTFKTEFKEWLQSIPQYPKAFKFQMSSILDLVNFRANDLFPDDKVVMHHILTNLLILKAGVNRYFTSTIS